MRRMYVGLVLGVLAAGMAFAQDEKPYEQVVDHVYVTHEGADFYMDIFTPKGKKNGLAIIDVASGAWHADRGKIDDHEQAQMYNIFCGKGYMVFAVRPGSRGDYDVLQMAARIKDGIRWVKHHAAEYGIDPKRIGLTGASAGGHLASLTAVTPEQGSADAPDPLAKLDTSVKAVGIFFPPTDFIEWTGGTGKSERLGDIFFQGGYGTHTDEEIKARATEASPALQIKGKTPPFLIYHGDADPLVPLRQSEILVEALKKHGNQAELIVVPGGAHPWPTIPEEVAKLADWFDKTL
ncbi:MAG: alpha/beta hydrolase [Candidatus Hydrogenedentes bacterium]|nr:alpha/beta hydrolase [Candidatus Hydrogenedentota bacterium]